ncbi:hypothetical protein CO151_11255 [bacterium CG_4_9_14_3_um_filter_65_15]|nr:MAG: hypothetical protein CO151_11255 [bacterium CG_4_9_14_3_um_filter_65_15]
MTALRLPVFLVSRLKAPAFSLLWLLVAADFSAAVAQATGSLSVRVRDTDSHEPLIGVDIALVGADRKGATDLDGVLTFTDLRPGKFKLRLSYLGYNTKFMTGLEVAGGETTRLQIDLESFQAYATDDLVVSAGRILSTEAALLASRKSAGVVGDAISAAQISRTPDGTSGDALKRVPGLTVRGGKYIYVRGVTDRYNVTEINGVTMTGTNIERDRKSFNFDMVPSNLLANVSVIKTATPDMPGDFSGGLVRINTMEFPDRATTAVGISTAGTEGTTGESFFMDTARGDREWLAMDHGHRALPSGLADNDLARALPNRWEIRESDAPSKYSWNISHGGKTTVAGRDLGYMGAVSYRNGYTREDGFEQRKADVTYGGQDKFGIYQAARSEVLWGGLFNSFLRLGHGHRLGVSNFYTRSSDNTITTLQGEDSDKLFSWRTFDWQERYQFIEKIDGIHQLGGPGSGIELDWNAYYGESHASEPDRRYLEYNIDDPESPIMDENLRTWGWLDELRRGYRVDLTWMTSDDPEDSDHTTSFKFGLAQETKTRSFEMEAWYAAYTFAYQSFAFGLLSPDEIFASENFNETVDVRGHGFNFQTDRLNSGRYTGKWDLTATYLMADVPFGLFQEDLRLTGGVRLEEAGQFVLAWQDKFLDRPDTAMVDKRDLLPSVNLTWIYDEHTNLRLGYYQSVNRPEFRELAPVNRRNFKTFQNEFGNAELKRAGIENYDLRAEYFPGYGQVVAGSLFYKDFRDAIEQRVFPSPERSVLSWTNSPRGRNYGFELEVRRKLDRPAMLEDFSVSLNYTRVWSEVDFRDLFDGQDKTRPLQGQAPWVFNAGLQYDNPNTGTSINVLYNKVGRNLDKVGDSAITNIYLEPRDRLDLLVGQQIASGLKFKISAEDVLGQDILRTSGPEQEPYDYAVVEKGATYSLSVQYKF